MWRGCRFPSVLFQDQIPGKHSAEVHLFFGQWDQEKGPGTRRSLASTGFLAGQAVTEQTQGESRKRHTGCVKL